MKEITEDKGRIRPVVEGDFQCDENGNSTRFYEILSIVGIVDNTTKLSYISKKNVPVGIPITNEEYWYPFQVIAVPKGDKGDDGKSAYDLYIEHGGTIATVEEWLESLHGADGISPILRISPDGLSIEISSDNGQTWLPFQKDFNKLRVLGYVDSIAELPASANIGDIYGVWNQQAQSGAGAYELYIQTVRDWILDYTITKVYDYDTELPSSAADGTAVLVPVTDLTLDKEKIDGYKVYRYSLTNNGWIMILNTAEIYANKTDIINYGDNIYALVQSATEGTYELYKRSVGWVQFGTNASITYHLIQNISDATSTNVLSGKAVKDAIEAEAATREEAVSEINQTIDNYKEEVKETYGDYIENPEFVRAVTDKDDKVLYGVQADGNFYFGAGCPQQVKDYVQQQIDTVIGVGDVTEKIDTINEMIAFFDEISHDTTLKELLAASAQAVAEEKTRAEGVEQHLNEIKANKEEVNAALDTKVDKEEGKSLIDAEYAATKSTVYNPEFLEVTTDSEDKVLEGIQQDGTKVIGGDINVGGSASVGNSASVGGDFTVLGNMEVAGVTYQIIENPEYLAAWLDTENKVIFGLKADGKTYVGDADFLNEIKNNQEVISEIKAILGTISSTIESLDIDALSSIMAIEGPEYLKVELDTENKVLSGTKIDGSHYAYNMQSETIDAKVDKEDGKSLIDTDYASSQSSINNPEYLKVTTDTQGKVLCGIKNDGTVYIPILDNPGIDSKLNEAIQEFNEKAQQIEDDIDAKLALYDEIFSCFNLIEDPESRSEITTDSEDKIISYRGSDGVKHEEIGINAKQITTDSMILPDDAISQVDERIDNHVAPKNWYLPKFGKVNIKSETFYLTADSGWSTKDDVVCIQMYDDTEENARQRMTLSYYYIKSTLTPLADGGYDRTSVDINSIQLQLFAGKDVVESNGQYFVKKITKVNGEYYLTSTLAENNGVYDINYLYGQANSMKVNYSDENPDQTTLTNAIEVGKITDIPPYKAWFVGKQLEHYCIADINYGSFYSNKNVPVGIKYQGSGTTAYRKRGLRLTFYKKNDYKKKDKVKIGEMIRLSGYNMKAYAGDPTRVKDPVFSNLFIEVWQTRGKDCYPWNKDNCSYNGATGFIKSFPIETWFGEEFYGLQLFGLKKDERNYMLDGDDDTSGIFVSGADGSGFYSASHINYEDEMMDEMSQETADAIDELEKYLKGFVDGTIEIDGQIVDFTNSMLEEHIDIYSWIDYWIGLETFMLYDNDFHNAILYSGRDKKKFYLFFYDLDVSMDDVSKQNNSYMDYMENVYRTPIAMAFWKKFTEEYKDYIINRYAELRKSVLTVENINSIYKSYIAQIPANVVLEENAKWGVNSVVSFDDVLKILTTRLEYLDNNYFNV